MRGDVVFHFLVVGAAQRARAERDNLFYIAHGSLGINRRRRTAIRWKRKRGQRSVGSCSRFFHRRLGGRLIAITGHVRPRQGRQNNEDEGCLADQIISSLAAAVLDFYYAFFACRACRCLGCTNHAMPMLTTYSAIMGAAKTHMFTISGVGVTMAAMMKITRME